MNLLLNTLQQYFRKKKKSEEPESPGFEKELREKLKSFREKLDRYETAEKIKKEAKEKEVIKGHTDSTPVHGSRPLKERRENLMEKSKRESGSEIMELLSKQASKMDIYKHTQEGIGYEQELRNKLEPIRQKLVEYSAKEGMKKSFRGEENEEKKKEEHDQVENNSEHSEAKKEAPENEQYFSQLKRVVAERWAERQKEMDTRT